MNMIENVQELRSRIAECERLLAVLQDRTPGFGPYMSVQAQLEAVSKWVSAGLPLKQDDVSSLTMHVIAVREFEVLPFDEAQELANGIYAVVHFAKDNTDPRADSR